MTHTCSKPNGSHARYPRFTVEEIQIRPSFAASGPSHHEIAELAYSYWEAAGRRNGRDWEDWFRAEQDLRARRLAYAAD